jgi:hypothetical protein
VVVAVPPRMVGEERALNVGTTLVTVTTVLVSVAALKLALLGRE